MGVFIKWCQYLILFLSQKWATNLYGVLVQRERRGWGAAGGIYMILSVWPFLLWATTASDNLTSVKRLNVDSHIYKQPQPLLWITNEWFPFFFKVLVNNHPVKHKMLCKCILLVLILGYTHKHNIYKRWLTLNALNGF